MVETSHPQVRWLDRGNPEILGHADQILRDLNNLICLSGFNPSEEICSSNWIPFPPTPPPARWLPKGWNPSQRDPQRNRSAFCFVGSSKVLTGLSDVWLHCEQGGEGMFFPQISGAFLTKQVRLYWHIIEENNERPYGMLPIGILRWFVWCLRLGWQAQYAKPSFHSSLLDCFLVA